MSHGGVQLAMLGMVFLADMASPGSCSCDGGTTEYDIDYDHDRDSAASETGGRLGTVDLGCPNPSTSIEQCGSYTCSTYPAATDATFYVDPLNGNDTAGTGDNSINCRFKTIRRALAAVGRTPKARTTVRVLAQGTIGGTLGNGDTFPIAVPSHVTIRGTGASGIGDGIPKVIVPRDTHGFIMNAPDSALDNLDIEGQSQNASSGTTPNGIYVTSGSDATTVISRVTVHGFASDGIRVAGAGILVIGDGVTSAENGNEAFEAMANGLRVGGTDLGDTAGKAFIEVISGTAAIHFDNNTANGISVEGLGSVTIHATPATGGSGTVTTNRNGAAGVSIRQTMNGERLVPANNITGLVAWGNALDGIRAYGGSSLKLRKSVLLANAANGVKVISSVGASCDITQINLGQPDDVPNWGANTLQSSAVTSRNNGAGICLVVDNDTKPVLLNGAGNVFSAAPESSEPINCAVTSTTPTLKRSTDCTGAVDVSVYSPAGSAHEIDVSNCQ